MGDERSEKINVVSKEITIKPGMSKSTELRFPGEGHQRFAHECSDLVITITEMPHKQFKRTGNDLIYHHKISLLDSLLATPVHFNTLNNEKIEISVD